VWWCRDVAWAPERDEGEDHYQPRCGQYHKTHLAPVPMSVFYFLLCFSLPWILKIFFYRYWCLFEEVENKQRKGSEKHSKLILAELSVIMEMCSIQYTGHCPLVAAEHLTCGRCNWEPKF
jgi:hypothetical protein